MIDKRYKYSNGIYKDLLYCLLRLRMVEERIAKEYTNQEIRCPTHLYIGEEAIATGVCAHLRKKDIVFSYHRSHGHYLAKGGSLRAMVAELYGKETGCSRGMGGSQHLIDLSVNFCGAIPIVSETIPLAVGAGFAEKMKGTDVISTVFFGDAATEEGIFAESVNFAVLKQVPVLFVCENNFYSISTHILERQPTVSIAPRASGMGIKTFTGDGNDVMDVYNKTASVLAYMEKNKKPAFLEFQTYRLLEHCGHLYDPPGVRPDEDMDVWTKRDPVQQFIKFIVDHGITPNVYISDMRKKIDRELDDAFIYALKSPYPKPNLGSVYA